MAEKRLKKENYSILNCLFFAKLCEKCVRRKKPLTNLCCKWLIFSDLGEDRTLDPLIKSQLLYRLSYQVMFSGLQRNEKFLKVGKSESQKSPKVGTF